MNADENHLLQSTVENEEFLDGDGYVYAEDDNAFDVFDSPPPKSGRGVPLLRRLQQERHPAPAKENREQTLDRKRREADALREEKEKRRKLILDQLEPVVRRWTTRSASPTAGTTSNADEPAQMETAGAETNTEAMQTETERSDLVTADSQNTVVPQPTRVSARIGERRAAGTQSSRWDVYAKTYRISVKQALMGARSQEAREAIIGEIMNMLNYKVGHYVHHRDIPQSKRGNIIQCFMFLKEKTRPDGSYDKTKARLVGNGANQKEHMYDFVSSSTVALSSVFMLFNLASYFKCTLATFDIKGAFLHAEFGARDEVIFIRIPREVATLWVQQDEAAAAYIDSNGTLLLELDKFIYGLKQSPYKFQLHLQQVLLDLGYAKLSQDDCLYVTHLSSGGFSVLSTHVDDILQVTTDPSLYTELKSGLIKVYGEITATDTAEAYLGMKIERSDCKSYLRLTQLGLVEKITQAYPRQQGDRHKYTVPADASLFDCSAHEGANALNDDGRREFLSVVMTLMYLARLTRPDVLLAVTYMASRTHRADSRDVECMRRVIRYLESTKERGVVIHCTALQLYLRCDASYGTHTPASNCYGHTGYIVGFGESLSYVHARSGKQKVASTSSTDAEIIALVEAVKMSLWLREILRELRVTPLTSIVASEDNMSTIHLTDSAGASKRSKHLLTKITYLRWVVLTGALDVVHIPTEEQTADVLSKPLQGAIHKLHIDQMMGTHWESGRTCI